jgi:hypothetical protein
MFEKIFKGSNNNLTKSISVYISDGHKHLIIASMHQNGAGINYEQKDCFTADYPIDSTEFGNEVIKNLNQYSVKDTNLRESKKTDWPAFKHSRSKSVTGFENEYINIFIRSANDSNLILTIEGRPFKTSELTINSSVSFHADKQELGQRINEVYQACLTRVIPM